MSRLTTRELAAAALFTALTAAAALVSVPLGSVPFTLQVLVVLVAGIVLGPRLGALSMVAYLVLGLIAPVYAGGMSGVGVLFGPTGGYLWGFVPAAALAGVVATGAPTHFRHLAAGLAGLVPIYALGALWLGVQLRLDAETALATGVAPFIWIDLLKALAATLVARALVSLPLGLPSLQRGR